MTQMFSLTEISKPTAIQTPAVAKMRDTSVARRLSDLAAMPDAQCIRVDVPVDPQDRARFVRDWIAKRTLAAKSGQAAKSGLAASVLILPLALEAAAQTGAESQFYYADTLSGVVDVSLNADGSATLTMSDGRAVLVDKDDVQVLADGQIAVKGALVSELVIGPMIAPIAAGAVGVFAGLAAADGAAALPDATEGIVVDGYIVGATVFRDLNNNGVLDASEPFAITGDGGVFELAHTADPASLTARLISYGGFDSVTGAEITGSWSAPASATVVSPLASLVQSLIEGGASEQDAIATVQGFFDLGDVNPLTADPVVLGDAGSADVLKAAATVQSVMSNTVAMAKQAGAASQADLFTVSQKAAAQIVEKLTADKTALTKADAVKSIITETVTDADDATANDVAGAVSKLNDAVAKVVIPSGAVPGAVNAAVRQIETLQTVGQKEIVEKIAGGETGLDSFAQTSIDSINSGSSLADDQPYRPTLASQRVAQDASDNTLDLVGRGLEGSTVQINLLNSAGISVGTGTAVVDAAGNWAATLTFDGALATGLYDVSLSATLGGRPPSVGRSAPLIVGEVGDFSGEALISSFDFFFHGTDLSVLKTNGSVSTSDETLSLFPALGQPASFSYTYTDTNDAFSAGVVDIAGDVNVLVNGAYLGKLDALEVRVIEYTWDDGGTSKSSVVLTLYDPDREGGFDYVGQLGGDVIPDFATVSQADAWVKAAVAAEVGATDPLGPGQTIGLPTIQSYLETNSRDWAEYDSAGGFALPGSYIEVFAGATSLGTATANAEGFWFVAAAVDAGNDAFDGATKLQITDPTNGVDVYHIATSGADSIGLAASARNVLIDFNLAADTIDLTDLGITSLDWTALTNDAADLTNVDILGVTEAKVLAIGVDTLDPIFVVGLDTGDLGALQTTGFAT